MTISILFGEKRNYRSSEINMIRWIDFNIIIGFFSIILYRVSRNEKMSGSNRKIIKTCTKKYIFIIFPCFTLNINKI